MPEETRPGWSLRRRLIGFTLGAALAVWSLSAIALYAVATRATGQAADAAIMDAAGLLLAFADHEYRENDGDFAPVVATPGNLSWMQYQIWSADHRLLLRSASAPRIALSSRFEAGLRDERLNGERWRVYSASTANGALWIEIGEPYSYRLANGQRVVFALLATVLTCAVSLLTVLWLLINRVASHVDISAREIGSRNAGDLSPLSPAVLPQELAPLIQALNALLTRLDTALQSERRLTADASHELRTPLAVIKAQAQLARRAQTTEARAQALEKLEAGIDRATRMVEQLLTAARIDPMFSQLEVSQRNIDVRAEVLDLLEGYRDLIEKKRLRVTTDLSGEPWVCNAALARILIRNLLDNALRYTPESGQVRVRYAGDLGGQVLEFSDSGPGIPESERTRVFDPYYRGRGIGGTGTGLGLSIVRHIVQGLGGTITFGPGIGGAGVTIHVYLPTLPARAETPAKAA